MKLKIKFIGVFFAVIFIASTFPNNYANAQKQPASTTEDAIAYNDYIIDEEIKVIEKINELDDAVGTYDPNAIETAIKEAKSQILESYKKIEKVKTFNGDQSFKKATLSFFKMFEIQLDQKYSKIAEYYKLSDEEYTETEEAAVNTLLKEIDSEYETEFKKFTDTQKAFADKFNFTIAE